MTYVPGNPLYGDSLGRPEAWIGWAEAQGAHRLDDVRAYVRTVYDIAPRIGVGAHKLIVQSIHETTEGGVPWASLAWTACCNPAGIGVTDDSKRTWHDFRDGRTAALAHLVHVSLYVLGEIPDELEEYRDLDPRWRNVTRSILGRKRTLQSFGGSIPQEPTWAVDPLYGTKWADRLNDLAPIFTETPAHPAGDEPMALTQVPITIEQRFAWNRFGDYGILSNLDAEMTIHENGNDKPGVDAYAEARFVASGGGDEQVLYHFAVDHLRAVQIVPLKYRGRHAGNALGNAISAAIETVQAPPGPLSDATQRNLRWLLVAIVTRDPRIDFGDGGHRFSFDRMRGHKDWPGANPRCPRFMTERWGGVAPVIAGARVLAAQLEKPAPPLFRKGQMVATTAELNVRQGPGLTHEVTGTLPIGTDGMKVLDGPVYEGGFEWYDVAVSPTWGTGWVAGEYLAKALVPVPAPKPREIVFAYDTAMRDSASFTGKNVGVAKAGADAVILEGPKANQGASWYRVRLGGTEAWIPDTTSTFRQAA